MKDYLLIMEKYIPVEVVASGTSPGLATGGISEVASSVVGIVTGES